MGLSTIERKTVLREVHDLLVIIDNRLELEKREAKGQPYVLGAFHDDIKKITRQLCR